MNKQEQIKELKQTIEKAKSQVERLEKEMEEDQWPTTLEKGEVYSFKKGPYTYTGLVIFEGGYDFVTLNDGNWWFGVRGSEEDLITYVRERGYTDLKKVADSLEDYYREKFKIGCEWVHHSPLGDMAYSSAKSPKGTYYKL